MKQENNIYRITYKNGRTLECEALMMKLVDGQLHQMTKQYPFENVTQSIIDGTNIAYVECIERNNDIEEA